MMKLKITIICLFILTLFFVNKSISAQDCNTKDGCQSLIEEYTKKLENLGQQKNTLSSQINLMDTQINLTAARILETGYRIGKLEEEILNLGDKIEGLNTSLDYLGRILLKKIAEGYKRHETPFLDIFLDSERASTLVNRLKYAKTAQENDRRLAFQVQQAKLNFEEQKKLREEKKLELDRLKATLDNQKTDLNNQKGAKQKLLAVTQNDERTYQGLLAKAQSEFAAIQGIIAGAGTESLLREVAKGQSIASVIPGPSCNSGGTHLHFIVKDGGTVNNPFSYLKPVDHSNCSGSSCGSSDGDPFNPSGSWDWPVSPAIELEQGYGSTWAVRNTYVGRIYSFHNGLDINGTSNTVVTVADGTLYRGSFSGGGGCALPYAKVKHKDADMETYYLHVYVN